MTDVREAVYSRALRFDASMENYLSGVPAGTFEISKRNPPDFIFEKLTAKTSGRGRIEIFSLFPGIELSVHRYNAEEVSFHHDEKASVLEINHCRRGRIGWNMRGRSFGISRRRRSLRTFYGKLFRFQDGYAAWIL